MKATDGKSSIAKDEVSPSPRVSQQRGQRWLQTGESPVGERESTWGTRIREPDDFVLHLLEREGVTVVDVGEKFFVCLLVA